MSDICKETLCTRCAHLQVCSKKEAYLTVLESVKNLRVHTSDGHTSPITNFPWIHLGEPKCDYYLTNRVTRRVETSNVHSQSGL